MPTSTRTTMIQATGLIVIDSMIVSIILEEVDKERVGQISMIYLIEVEDVATEIDGSTIMRIQLWITTHLNSIDHIISIPNTKLKMKRAGEQRQNLARSSRPKSRDLVTIQITTITTTSTHQHPIEKL